MERDTLYYWVGYSWIPDPNNTKLAVHVIETTCGSTGLKKTETPILWSESTKDFLHKWSVKMDPATFPLAGLEKPTGISGLMGFHPSALSDSFGDGKDWVDQQVAYDYAFEKNLSTILYAIIRKIYASHRSRKTECNSQKTVVSIQGPIFSQVLDKIDMFCSCDGFLVSFVTFFRRYLLPNPFLQRESKVSMQLFGPDPSAHEASLVKRYYLHPNATTSKNEPVSYPIMIELPEGGGRFSSKASMIEEMLTGLGIHEDQNQQSYTLKRRTEWSWHPSPIDLLKVYTPKFLLEANKASQNQLTGQDVQITTSEIMRVLKADVREMSTRAHSNTVSSLANVARDDYTAQEGVYSLYAKLPDNKRDEIETLYNQDVSPIKLLSAVIKSLGSSEIHNTNNDNNIAVQPTKEPGQGSLL